MNNQKYCFVDIETTGLDKKTHNIFQIHMIIADHKLKEIDQFEVKFRPHSMDRVEVEAMNKTKTSIEELNSYELSSEDGFNKMIEFLSQHCNRYDKNDKLYFVAYNAPFDADFLREFFAKHDDQYFGSWFWTPALCVMQLAAWTLVDGHIRPKMANFKLETLCKVAEIGWDDSQAHDAAYDNIKTLNLLKSLKSL